MSQANIDAVRRAIRAWNTGDFDALIAESAPEIEWDLSHVDAWPEKDTYQGVPELRSFWDMWLETWDDHHIEALRFLANGDKVFFHYRQTAVGKASGVSVEVELSQVTTFRDGKAIRNVLYSEPDEAARAAGVTL